MNKHVPIETIERCHKETENVFKQETPDFLHTPVSYLKQQMDEFVFVHSSAFEEIRIDGLALEVDDVFQTYTALFGLALQKKMRNSIQSFLDANLHGEGIQYSILFSGEDGVWDVNLTLDGMEDFNESRSLDETVQLVVQFVSDLLKFTEDGN